MLEQLAFALVAMALGAPLVPVLLSQQGQSGQDTAAVAQDKQPIHSVGRKIATAGAVLIAISAFVQTADAQQSWRPLSNDPEQFRMIEECLDLTFGRSGGKETTRMYEACLDRQLAAQGSGPTSALPQLDAEPPRRLQLYGPTASGRAKQPAAKGRGHPTSRQENGYPGLRRKSSRPDFSKGVVWRTRRQRQARESTARSS